MSEDISLIKVKKVNPNAIIPTYAKKGDAGMDLTAVSMEYDNDRGVFTYGIGLAFAIPEGYVGLIYPRSSVYKKNLILANQVAVIDSGFRGEVLLKFRTDVDYYTEADTPIKDNIFQVHKSPSNKENGIVSKLDIYGIGDRIGQMIIMPYPKVAFVDVRNDKLSKTDRNDKGFGSTGS